MGDSSKPLVTVICISYNHVAYVREALCSLRDQLYGNTEIILADDASTDGTQAAIYAFLAEHPSLNWKTVFNEQNTGNCSLFNKAFVQSSGEYVIDLAADDFLYPDCIARQVSAFHGLSEAYGIVFTNVDMIDVQGKLVSKQYPVDKQGQALQKVPTGDIYRELVRHYIISPVGMLIKRTVLEELGGYDETLAYEDFDLWVRSSRKYQYAYLDVCLVAKRKTAHSLSTKFLAQGNQVMFASTARVCEKIAWLNQSKLEDEALKERLTYEIKQAIRYKAPEAVAVYLKLLKKVGASRLMLMLYACLWKIRKLI